MSGFVRDESGRTLDEWTNRGAGGRVSDLVNILGPLDGGDLPGGCEDCDAYQTVGQLERGVWSVTVHHDDDCPTLRSDSREAKVMGDLLERVGLLGKMTLRGDIDRWIHDLDAAGEVRRVQLIRCHTDHSLVDLVRLVHEYGGPAVLEAVVEAGVRLRRERIAGQS